MACPNESLCCIITADHIPRWHRARWDRVPTKVRARLPATGRRRDGSRAPGLRDGADLILRIRWYDSSSGETMLAVAKVAGQETRLPRERRQSIDEGVRRRCHESAHLASRPRRIGLGVAQHHHRREEHDVAWAVRLRVRRHGRWLSS